MSIVLQYKLFPISSLVIRNLIMEYTPFRRNVNYVGIYETFIT